MNNYYEARIKLIRAAIADHNFFQARQMLSEELAMPYIPHQFETIFHALSDEVARHEKSDLRPPVLSETQVKEMLLSNDEQAVAIALSHLPRFNLHAFRDELSALLEQWRPPRFRYQKAYLFELLVEQHVDLTITFEDGVRLNAQLTPSIFRHENVQTAFKALSRIFFKEPAKLEVARAQLNYYLLLTYPAIPSNGETTAMMLASVVNSYFGDATPLSKAEKAIAMLLASK